MSKYIKLEDAIYVDCIFMDQIECKDCSLYDEERNVCRMVEWLESLPTIEVSEGNDCMLTMFGECSYNETGCGSCAVAEKIRKALSVEVSEDCISREYLLSKVYDMDNDNLVVDLKDIENAPSVVPSRAEGEWVRNFDGNEWYWYCTNCKTQWYEDDLWMGGNEFPNYCPNCGAKMKG